MQFATSKNLTVLGIAGMVAGVANAVVLLFDGNPATNPDWNALIALIYSGIIALLAKGQASTGGTVATTPEAATRLAASATPPAPPAPAAGFVRIGLLALLVGALLAVLSLPLLVRADEGNPKFGGCLSGGRTCFGPSVSISLVQLNLETGAVTTGIAPGLGYGAIFWSDQWYQTGVHGYATFRDTDAGQRLVASGVVSFADYLRVGVGQQIGSKDPVMLLLGVGTSFGQSGG